MVALGGRAIAAEGAKGHASVRLIYDVDRAVDDCPSEREIRDAIAARLGYDPFTVDRAPRDLVLRVTRNDKVLDGSLEVRGDNPGRRSIDSPAGDCRELGFALATAAAIMLDPESLSRPPPEEPRPEPPPEAPSAPAAGLASSRSREALNAPSEPSEPWRPIAALQPELLVGELPAPTFGAAVAVGARRRGLSLSIEGAATLRASDDLQVGTVTASMITGGLLPCVHLSYVFACVSARIGALSAEGSRVTDVLSATKLYAGVGPRLGIEVPLGANLSVRAHADGVIPITHVHLELDTRNVWATPTVTARVGLGVAWYF